jgi:hypothetical protein
MIIRNLLDEIRSNGDRGAVVPFSHAEDIKNDLIALRDNNYHTSWLDRMVNHLTGDEKKYIPADMAFEPRSLISIVMPSPKVILQFAYCEKTFHIAIPPGYRGFYTMNERPLSYLKKFLAQYGYSAATAETFPQKMLAVHCGLAQCCVDMIICYQQFRHTMCFATGASNRQARKA